MKKNTVRIIVSWLDGHFEALHEQFPKPISLPIYSTDNVKKVSLP